MPEFPFLSLMTFLPLVGIFIILMIRGDETAVAKNSRYTALYTSLFTLALAIYMFVKFDGSSADFQFVEKVEWLRPLGISYHMGIDGISMFFVFLSALLTPVCIFSAWESVQKRVKEYMVAFLALETFMIGTFCALDSILFYVFFEAVLIPMFIMIGVWGGPRRVYASYKFFLYTRPMLAYVLAILLFSMSGIPPMAGFFGKLMIFEAAVERELYVLAVLGVITSVVAAYYYLRIIKVMFFDSPAEALDRDIPFARRAVMFASLAFVLGFIVKPSLVIALAKNAAAALFAG